MVKKKLQTITIDREDLVRKLDEATENIEAWTQIRDGAEAMLKIFDEMAGARSAAAPEAARAALLSNKRADAILAFLAETPGQTPTEIAAATQIDRFAVNNTLGRLKRNHKVTVDEAHRYTLAPPKTP